MTAVPFPGAPILLSDTATAPANARTALEYRRRICLAMNFISENLDRDLTLEEIAGASSFSKFHFHRIFKAVVGETVSAFTRRLRLEWAANLLISADRRDITGIAMDCGFSSSQNFAKAFRRHFGLPPSSYRKSNGGNIVSNAENVFSLRTEYGVDALLPDSCTGERRYGMNVEVREMTEHHVAFVRKMGPYGKETAEQAFGELLRWAGPRGYAASGMLIGLYWDNPEVTPPDRCRSDACVTVPAGTITERQIGLQNIAGGLYAVCRFEIFTDDFPQAWDEAFRWLVNSGYECDDKPSYEMFRIMAEDHPAGKWGVDICIPLKRP